MYTKKYIENELIKHFAGYEVFSREKLYAFLRELDPDLKESTFTWRIYDLKKRQIIKDVRKGVYTLADKQAFKPEPDEMIGKIGHHLQNIFIHHYYNIWSTAWLNELTELQATSFLYVMEVDRYSMETVFFSLKDKVGLKSVFISPDSSTISNYVSELPWAIVVEPMLSRAPTMRVKGVTFPTLEKILVDLFCDPKLYYAYQGQQLVQIFEAALSKYIINFSRLLNYAKRRSRDEAIKNFLFEHEILRDLVVSKIE